MKPFRQEFSPFFTKIFFHFYARYQKSSPVLLPQKASATTEVYSLILSLFPVRKKRLPKPAAPWYFHVLPLYPALNAFATSAPRAALL